MQTGQFTEELPIAISNLLEQLGQITGIFIGGGAGRAEALSSSGTGTSGKGITGVDISWTGVGCLLFTSDAADDMQ